MSTRALAEAMQAAGFDWHHNTVLRTENAKRPIRLAEAVALAGILKVDLGFLLRPGRDEDVRVLREELVAVMERVNSAIVQVEKSRERFRHVEDARRSARDEYDRAMAAFVAAERQRDSIVKSMEDAGVDPYGSDT